MSFFSSSRRSRHSRGFTLTELAIVMGIIGVVLGSIWIAVSSLMTAQKSKQAAAQITVIANNIRYLYGPRGGFTTISEITGSLINAKVFPVELLSSTQTGGVGNTSSQIRPVNAWGATVAIYIVDMRQFRIAFYGTDAASCTRIASAIIGTQDNGTTGPVTFITDGGGSGAINLTTTTMTSQTISTACALNTNTSTATNSTEFDFKLQ